MESNQEKQEHNVPMSVLTYMDMDKTYDSIEDRIRETYPNCCVLWIQEIHNQSMMERFEQRKLLIESERGFCHVKSLFHGTSEHAINTIAHQGFSLQKCKVCAHGFGIYFSTSAKYSSNYAVAKTKNDITYMFLCDVLVGKVKKGSNFEYINKKSYDNFVDNTTRPTMYITPYEDAILPRYIIAFYKNAK